MATETKEVVKEEVNQTQTDTQVNENPDPNKSVEGVEETQTGSDVDTSNTEIVDEAQDDEGYAEEKVRQSDQRMFGNRFDRPAPMPPAPVQAPPQQNEPKFLSDLELQKLVNENPDLSMQVEQHRRERDTYLTEKRIENKLTTMYYFDQVKRQSLMEVMDDIPQLNNPKSRVSRMTDEIYQRDPFLQQNPNGWSLAAYKAQAKLNGGVIQNAINKGRSDGNMQRKIVGKIVQEKQTAPAPKTTSSLSDQDRSNMAQLGVDEASYLKLKNRASGVMASRQR